MAANASALGKEARPDWATVAAIVAVKQHLEVWESKLKTKTVRNLVFSPHLGLFKSTCPKNKVRLDLKALSIPYSGSQLCLLVYNHCFHCVFLLKCTLWKCSSACQTPLVDALANMDETQKARPRDRFWHWVGGDIDWLLVLLMFFSLGSDTTQSFYCPSCFLRIITTFWLLRTAGWHFHMERMDFWHRMFRMMPISGEMLGCSPPQRKISYV